ncbi:SRPBCC family protein [Streptomyces sp. TRM49041]|uniref:SRPBCC family protein n=1 Tax=Streptomyces sp. TRM49041 TaxID=2603216 RepID=UPI0011EDA2BC|nr:SRPBCC family protein [Streptomyces sp. TRM49041]
MSSIKESVVIDRRPEEVYAYVSDPTHLPEWQESAVEAHQVGDTPLGVGSRVEVTRQVGKRVIPMTMEVTEFDPPRSWRMHGVEGPVRPDLRGTVESIDDGTRSRLTLDLNIEGHGKGKLLVPMVIRPFARKEMPSNERRLKSLLEGGDTTA